jgi:alcohol dehydrogenase (cytochrome c)
MSVRSGPVKYEAPLVYMGTFPDPSLGTGPRTGWVYSVDAGDGRVRWRYHAASPVLSGATPTAGGLVFSGESAGNLLVFDARDGALLKSLPMGGSMGGGVISYEVGGRQYVATTAGNVSRSGLSTGDNFVPRLIVLTIGLGRDYQPLKVLAVAPEELKHRFGPDPGKGMYNAFCSGCHGRAGVGGEGGPALVNEAGRKSLPEVIDWIKKPAPPMPSLSPPLSSADVESVAGYVMQLK